MKDITKYQGVIPAFYACYDAEGNISTEGVKALTRHLIAKGVKGVYVGGSSGECIYQHVDERKAVLEALGRKVEPGGFAAPSDRFGRAALRLTLRQQHRLAERFSGSSYRDLVARWRDVFDKVSDTVATDDDAPGH